jgi:hypothetical protein
MARRHGSVWLEVAACLRRTTNVSWSWWPTNFHESCLDELYGLIQGGDMRITLSLGSVRVSVCAANPLSQQALRELNSEAFATLCEFATRAKWTDMPIDGVQLFAWHGECVPSFSLPPHIREVRSERAVFFEIAGICTRESGVSMAKVLLRALSAVGCANALTWFVSPDEAFFPDCEIDTEQRAIFVREIEKVGNVLKSDNWHVLRRRCCALCRPTPIAQCSACCGTNERAMTSAPRPLALHSGCCATSAQRLVADRTRVADLVAEPQLRVQREAGGRVVHEREHDRARSKRL